MFAGCFEISVSIIGKHVRPIGIIRADGCVLKCSRIIYKDQKSSFNELLNKDSSVSIHIRNIERFANEMFELYKGILSLTMENIFKLKTENTHKLRQVSEFSRPIVKKEYHGTENILYFEPKIWEIKEN